MQGKLEQPEPVSITPQYLAIGEAEKRRKIAYLRRRAAHIPGDTAPRKPGFFWLGGFRSGMDSVKARFLDSMAARENRACLRFDYSSHGLSDGKFEDARVGDWLAESLLMFQQQTEGPQIVIGSSMGGWLALLLARALAQSGESARLAGLALIAPATDFTEKLIWDRLSPAIQNRLMMTGFWLRPSAYSAEPDIITRGLIEEGRNHLLLGRPIRTHCPVHILQGMQDPDVPWRHAVDLLEHMAGDGASLALVKDGDHRLSRPEDLARLEAAIEAFS